MVIVPCHSLEDFPCHLRGRDAENLLACWTAAWHPALLATTNKKPIWQSVDRGEFESPDLLVFVPHICRVRFEESLLATSRLKTATIVSDELNRTQMIQSALQQNETARVANEHLDEELAKDFLALGYAFLQIQTMTRQLRYSSNLKEDDFFASLLGAARLACKGNSSKAKTELATCFDLLQAEKNSYYPVQPELIDLVLLAPTTLGASLNRQLSRKHNMNLLMTGVDARSLAKKNPNAAARICNGIESGQLSILGGLESELPDPLLSSESIVRQLSQGRKTIRDSFGVAPTVFARRSSGLTPALPGLLDQFDFAGAIHATLDEGKFPRGSTSNIRWTGCDGESVLAYGDLPVSAEDAAAFIGFGLKIGEAIDSAHIATFVLAHWPDRTCDFYDDLLRISEYGELLGKFVRMEDYFEQIYDPGYGDNFSVEEYQQPYLKRSVANLDTNPISRFTSYWQNHFRLGGCRALLVQLAMRTGSSQEPMPILPGFLDELTELEAGLDRSAAENGMLDEELAGSIRDLESRLTTAYGKALSAGGHGTATRCAVNPTHASRRSNQVTPGENRIALKQEGAVVFADSSLDQTSWVLDVPGMSSVRIPCGRTDSTDPFKNDPPVLAGLVLRNEFFSVEIDEQTGGIRNVQYHDSRQNLMSQRLALRIPGQSGSNPRLSGARYSEMVAEKIQANANTRIDGEITAQGKLVVGDETVADFRQTVRVVRGLRVFEIGVEIIPKIQLSDSINHYFCNRLAWHDESSSLTCNLLEMKTTVDSDWFLATNFIEIQQPDGPLTMLTGGLPYHRRTSRRMMDNLLIVGNEQERKFRLGIGIDLRYPMKASQNWLTPMYEIETELADHDNSAGWLFHFDCKNILVTWWQPIVNADCLTGVQIRLRETEGRAGNLNLRCCRNIQSAERVNFSGDFLRAEKVDDSKDKLPIEFAGWDYFQIKLNWET